MTGDARLHARARRWWPRPDGNSRRVGLDVQLTTADPRALDADFSKLTVHGGRINEMQMRALERAG